MKKCWARCLGDCSDKISGEHIVSQGLFESDMVRVQGFSWCKDEPKEIGLANLTKKVLCTKHNSDLSPTDDAGIAAFGVLKNCEDLAEARKILRERYWNVIRFEIDGLGLERWFLKTLINVAVGGEQFIGPNSRIAGEPSDDLVQIAFGKVGFAGQAGLYQVGEVGQNINFGEHVSVGPLFDQENKIVRAGTFHFRGWHFLLALEDKGFTDRITLNHKDGSITTLPRPSRHLQHLRFNVGPSRNKLSHVATFRW